MKVTLFYDHVTVLDYAFHDDHLGPVGHSQIVDVEFTGTTDEEGIVFDFSYAKKKVKEIIDRDCDHRFVVPKGMTEFKNDLAICKGSFGYEDQNYYYETPAEGICEIPYTHVSNETLITYLETLVMKEMPKTVSSVRLKLREEEVKENKFFFHYTHGLKDHYGNCQRLIHGHKSTIEVFINGKRDSEIESYMANTLFSSNIHLCYWENVVNKEEVIEFMKEETPGGRMNPGMNVEIAYESNQGKFKGIFPSQIIYLSPLETTVENLSIHFAQVVKENFAEGDMVTVRAFEGIAKGSKTSL